MFNIFIAIILILLYIALGIHFLFTIYAIFTGAPFIPSSGKNIRSMLKLTKPTNSDTLMDFGSGDGRIVFAASKSGATCIGVEINPLLVWWSRLRCKIGRHKNVTILSQDIWKTDLHDVDILTLFFIPIKMERLHEKILKEMKREVE